MSQLRLSEGIWDGAALIDPSSGSESMRPRARLIHTLGQDLISGSKVAVIELVKNAYDADASVVLVRFAGPLKSGHGAVEVWDDGHGMDARTASTTFLEIATPHRRGARRSEKKRRRVLGEKGIGRLAAGRLGAEMLLTTRREDGGEVELLVDWSAFEDPNRYLDEIEIAWSTRDTPTTFTDGGAATQAFVDAGVDGWQEGQGTVLRLERLATDWDDGELAELQTALSRLVSPPGAAGATPDFRVFLQVPPEHPRSEEFTGQVTAAVELKRSNYLLFGHVDASGNAVLTYEQGGTREEIQISFTVEGEIPRSGPFDLELRVWDRDRGALGGTFPDLKVTAARRRLDGVAGVSVYRDGFRVFPFGETGDDWLELDRRRIQNPTLRISNNQLLGHVLIGADNNPDLRDQSNREGIIDGPAYRDLRSQLQQAINEIERRRYRARRPEPKDERGGLFSRFDLTPVTRAVAERHPDDRELRDIVDQTASDVGEGVRRVQEVLSQFSRLAALSQIVDSVVHDGRTAVTAMINAARSAGRGLDKAKDDTDRAAALQEAADRTKVQVEILRTLFKRIEPFGGRKRGRPTKVDLLAVVADTVDFLRDAAAEQGVELVVDGEPTVVTVDAAEIGTVVVNLVQNAVYWTAKSPTSGTKPQVLVSVERTAEDAVDIVVSDTGPGVDSDDADSIFDPYFSTRPDGVGLGLANVGFMVTEYYDGSATLQSEGPLPGATFRVTLRRRV